LTAPLSAIKESKRRYVRPSVLLSALQQIYPTFPFWNIQWKEIDKTKHDEVRDLESRLVTHSRGPNDSISIVRFHNLSYIFQMARGYKFGVIYCKSGQQTDDEMFGNGIVELLSLYILKQNIQTNHFACLLLTIVHFVLTVVSQEHGSPAFEEFISFLGEKVRLKGWKQYAGGLNTKGLILHSSFFNLFYLN
jgi:hypothetical protein